ncbi:alpha/beta hydrolase [Chitinophaga sancti]|uniref:Alpha/beta hydrolase n=1 Tax=Chitinophaga sancti TaxID=1004 RepID=A0A1K1RB32_9BACT|nr:alpha/beta hydrolase [Chitinophaga sancti]WQD65549.1 alpha/beta hydrolase [Chitinophaga sancti]WQG88828.1 alpha/beta hydrolase [Chitinophaga sancti]SFW69137.1 Alpha/beta hydrolase family protein [Chitinophaga sancti]
MRMFVIALMLICCSCRKSDTTPANYPDDDLEGPVARPASGYGADGSYTVASVSFDSPTYSGKKVTLFYPKEAKGPVPVIFYSHPYGGEEVSYNIGLYNFIAKKGYAVVFAPYPTTGANVNVDSRYNTLWQSFLKAVNDYPAIIDTKKVGFMGHSFGGGASFAMAYKGFVENGWGENGRFIFAMAQWYSYNITATQLQSFPSNTKLITEVYNDDVTNDHRLAIDIFKHINIADSEKDYILAKQSVVNGYTYTAAHDLPSSRTAYDAYDYYVEYRLLDAMIDYSFNGNANAKNTALGNGSSAQVSLPQGMTPLEVTDNPVAAFPQSKYLFPCGSTDNPRIANCE